MDVSYATESGSPDLGNRLPTSHARLICAPSHTFHRIVGNGEYGGRGGFAGSGGVVRDVQSTRGGQELEIGISPLIQKFKAN